MDRVPYAGSTFATQGHPDPARVAALERDRAELLAVLRNTATALGSALGGDGETGRAQMYATLDAARTLLARLSPPTGLEHGPACPVCPEDDQGRPACPVED